MNYILYHENNSKHPYAPQEDSYFHSADHGVFVVADGITHDPSDPTLYPIPSDSYEVARLVCKEVVTNLINTTFTVDSIKLAYEKANKSVEEFNKKSKLYKNRKTNGFTLGAATTAMVWIKESKLLYGVLDDCFISVFSDDLVDHPILKSYVERSATYLDKNYNWEDIETRRHWREDIRNHKLLIDGEEYGYGAIDGRQGYEQYLQLGEVSVKPGDLVCVYTDGFIKLLKNEDLIKSLKDNPFSAETFVNISEQAINMSQHKEKTAYFIKIS